MKKFFLLLLALYPGLARSNGLELICDNAKVSFHSRWFRSNQVVVEGSENLVLPWTGRESLATGQELKETTGHLVEDLEPESLFLTFQPTNLLEPSLYIQRDLLLGQEQDGIVIIRPADPFRTRIHHCGSR